MEKFVISAAITGGMTVPGQSAAIPITPEEIVDSAVGAHEAGATIVHLHVREPETGKPSSDIGLFREVVAGIKERCDVIVQPTTGGGKGMTLEERAAVLPELEPEMATFNTGLQLRPLPHSRTGRRLRRVGDRLPRRHPRLHLPQHLR